MHWYVETQKSIMWLQLFGGGLPCQLGHLESSKKNCWTCPKYKGSNFYYLKTFLHPFFNESAMFFPIQICSMFKSIFFFLVDHLRQYGNSLYQNWLKVEQVYVGDLFSTYHLKMHYDSTLSAGLTKYIHSSRNDQG